MNALDNDDRQISGEYWKARCSSAEQQLHELQKHYELCSKQCELQRLENLQFVRVIRDLKNKLRFSLEHADQNGSSVVEEGYDLFYTFPEEVWPFILEYVPNSEDRLNLCDASPRLRAVVLDKDKPVWLFDQLFPQIFPWLEDDDVLTSRLVCQRWNQTIKNYNDSNNDPWQTSPLSQDSPSIWKTKLPVLDFDNTTDLRKFALEARTHLQTYQKSILFSRSIRLGLNHALNLTMNEVNEFWETALTLMQQIGPEIWHFEMYDDGLEDEATAFYSLLQQILCFLPNLKTFRLICELEHNRNQHNLIYRLGSWPLPCLPKLEKFHLLHSMPAPMTALLITSYASQIKRFAVSVIIFIQVDEDHLRGFVSLSELVLRDCVKDTAEFFVLLRKLQKVDAPNLEKIRLFRSYTAEEVVSLPYIFGLMQQFPKLRYLDTYRMEVVVKPWDSIQKLSTVYSLRTLKINNCQRLSFDFLENLPFLEELVIREDSRAGRQNGDQNQAQQLIEQNAEKNRVHNCIGNEIRAVLQNGKGHESGIWKMMPKLQKLTYDSEDERIIPSQSYSREMHEYLQKSREKEEKKLFK